MNIHLLGFLPLLIAFVFMVKSGGKEFLYGFTLTILLILLVGIIFGMTMWGLMGVLK